MSFACFCFCYCRVSVLSPSGLGCVHRVSPRSSLLIAFSSSTTRILSRSQQCALIFRSLGREKIIPPKSRITVNLGPLKAGRYSFVEEFHENEAGAQGTVIAE